MRKAVIDQFIDWFIILILNPNSRTPMQGMN